MTSEYFPRINMAGTARILAIFQIIFGLLLLGISIADATVYLVLFLIYSILGIVLGMWTCFTGTVGIKATREEPAFDKLCSVTMFTCGSFTSALGGVVVGTIWLMWYFASHKFQISGHVPAVLSVFSVIGIMICVIVIFIGIWITFYFCCQLGTCCDSIPPSQASIGAPVAFTLVTNAGNGALQTVPVGTQDNEPQIVLLPDSGEIENPPPHEAATSGYQIELVDMPPSYEEAARDDWRTYV